MVEKMNVEKYPSVPLCKFGNYCQFNVPHFIKLLQEIHSWGKYLLLHRELFALPLSVVLTALPKTLLGSSFSAKFLLEVLKQVLFRHTIAACPWGFPETDRQTDRQWSCCVTKCTILPSRYKRHFSGKAQGLDSEQSLDAGTALSALLFPLCPSTASHTPPVKVIFAKPGAPMQLSKAAEESYSPNIWVTPCSPATSGCCCVLCPSENQIPSWVVASMRVAGILSHLSVKVLPWRHWWKTWSFAVFTTGTLLSSLPNVPQQDRAMTHPLVSAVLRHRGLFQRHSPLWDFFPKTRSHSHLLCSLCWPIAGHRKSHFSQPRVHSHQ